MDQQPQAQPTVELLDYIRQHGVIGGVQQAYADLEKQYIAQSGALDPEELAHYKQRMKGMAEQSAFEAAIQHLNSARYNLKLVASWLQTFHPELLPALTEVLVTREVGGQTEVANTYQNDPDYTNGIRSGSTTVILGKPHNEGFLPFEG